MIIFILFQIRSGDNYQKINYKWPCTYEFGCLNQFPILNMLTIWLYNYVYKNQIQIAFSVIVFGLAEIFDNMKNLNCVIKACVLFFIFFSKWQPLKVVCARRAVVKLGKVFLISLQKPFPIMRKWKFRVLDIQIS